MNKHIHDGSWTRRRFLGWVVVLFVLQAGLIFLFGDHAGPRSRRVATFARVHALDASVDEEQLLREFFVGDPAVFVLPNHHDFSGRAWLDQRPLAYSPADQLEPPQWLAFNKAQLGAKSPFPAAGLEPFTVELTQEPEQRQELPPDFLPPETLPSRSIFRLGGRLRNRLLGPEPSLKDQPSEKILANSIVQIAVDPDGEVLSARVQTSCGSPEADANAVAKTLALRFRPAPSAGTQWGRAIFEWQTTAPSATAPPK